MLTDLYLHQGVDPNDPADDAIVLCYISVGEDLRTAVCMRIIYPTLTHSLARLRTST